MFAQHEVNVLSELQFVGNGIVVSFVTDFKRAIEHKHCLNYLLALFKNDSVARNIPWLKIKNECSIEIKEPWLIQVRVINWIFLNDGLEFGLKPSEQILQKELILDILWQLL